MDDPGATLRHKLFRRVPADARAQDPSLVLAWASQRLLEHSMVLVESAHWSRHRPWSRVFSIRTDLGVVWVKSNAAGCAHEGPLLELLGDATPDHVLKLFAVDATRGWLVAPDGGPVLTSHPGAGVAWGRFLTGYAGLQQLWSPLVDQAVLFGAADCRHRRILDDFEPALAGAAQECHGDFRLTGAQVDLLLACVPRLVELADELAASPVPPTVEHNDLHPDNVFMSGQLFDFADAVVAHPFLALASAVPDDASHMGLGLDSGALEALQTRYLAQFSDWAPMAQFRRTATVARALAHLPRAGSWVRLPPDGRALYPSRLPDRMRQLLAALA